MKQETICLKVRALINELLAAIPDDKGYFHKLKQEAFDELKELEERLKNAGK